MHITAKEALAVLKTFQQPDIIRHYAGHTVHLFVDSTVVVHALRKWYSPSLVLNDIISDIALLLLKTQYLFGGRMGAHMGKPG